MRVLLTAAPSTGHVVPLLGIGTALRDAGHEVRLATHRSAHQLADAAGLACIDVGMSAAAMVAERSRRWPDDHQTPAARAAVRMFTQILAPSAVPELARVLDDWRPNLVIHEEGEYAGPAVAAGHAIPWITHGWGSPLRSEAELATLEADAEPLWQSVSVPMPPAAGLYRFGVLNPCPAVLQSTPPGADLVWAIRPSTHPSAAAEVSNVERDERALAYVGFGTVEQFANDADKLARAVDAVTRHQLHAVVTASDDALAHELETQHPGCVRVHRFVALDDVLARCRLAVCHGGAGTVLAALQAGVPLVLLPSGTPSQHRMADACTRAGLALTPAVNDVAAAISRVLDDPGFARRAQAAGEEIAELPDPAAVVPLIEAAATA